MPKKISQEQFWKLYEKLPQELKDALFSDETGKDIYEICSRHEIEEKLNDIVDYVGLVLVGILAPEDFQKALEKELKINAGTTKEITKEINRLIFYPVKPALEGLYKIGTTEPVSEEKGKMIKEKTKEAEIPSGEDTYREPIE